MKVIISNINKYFIKYYIIFDILLLLTLSIVPFFGYGKVFIVESDIAYDINPSSVFLQGKYLWNGDLNFGIPNPYLANIYNILNITLYELNMSPFVIKQIWLSLLLFVAGLSMYYFIGVFEGKKKRLSKIVSSVFYMYSFYLLRMLLTASTMLISYAFLPLILGLYINGLNKEKKYIFYAILIALLSIFFSNLNLTLIVIDIIVVSIFLLVYIFTHKKINMLIITKFHILIIFIGFLISAWWVAPQIENIVLSQKALTGALEAETTSMYNGRSSYLETFRLIGEWGFYGQYKGVPNISFSKYYTKDSLLIISGFLLTVMSVCGLFFIREKEKRLYLFLLLALFLPLAVGVYPITNLTITGKIYLWLYDNVPLFSIFRNGYKSVAVISFVYAILLGYLVSSAYILLKRKFERINKSLYKLVPVFFVYFTFGIILINSYPLWSGLLFDEKKIKSVPTYWYELADYLNNQPLNFRIIAFPDSYFSVYYWGAPRGDVSLSLINKPIIETQGKAWGYKSFTKLFYENVSKKDLFNRMLSLSNIKYVLQRNDIDWNYYGTSSPEEIKEIVLGRDDLVFDKKIGELDLYKVKDNYFLPLIYSPTVLSYVSSDVDFNQFISSNDNNPKNGIFFSDFKLNGSSKNEFISNKINDIFVPIVANSNKITDMELIVDKTTDTIDKGKLQTELDLYTNGEFLKDFKLNIPAKATYKIYFKSDSAFLANKNVGVKIDNTVLQKDKQGIGRDGWDYFNQVELDQGEHSFKVYVDNKLINAINSGDIVFSAEDLAEPIKTPKLEYKQINPTKYIVNVIGATESFPLIFSESFHPGWKIYVQPKLAGKTWGEFVSEDNQGTIQNDNLNGGKFYDLLFRKPVLDDKHILINGFANSWWMDLAELEKQGMINKNKDGSYDFSVYMEFEPQKYFYIGLLISGVTLIGCVGYLIYDWKKRKFT